MNTSALLGCQDRHEDGLILGLFPSRHIKQHSAPKGTARGKGIAMKSVGIQRTQGH